MHECDLPHKIDEHRGARIMPGVLSHGRMLSIAIPSSVAVRSKRTAPLLSDSIFVGRHRFPA